MSVTALRTRFELMLSVSLALSSHAKIASSQFGVAVEYCTLSLAIMYNGGELVARCTHLRAAGHGHVAQCLYDDSVLRATVSFAKDIALRRMQVF